MGLIGFTVFVFVINTFSVLSKLALSIEEFPEYCDEKDDSCIRVAPFNQSQANLVINKYPISFKQYINTIVEDIYTNWADGINTVIFSQEQSYVLTHPIGKKKKDYLIWASVITPQSFGFIRDIAILVYS